MRKHNILTSLRIFIAWWFLANMLSVVTSSSLHAQLTITSPVNNQVIQRSVKDSAVVAVTGFAYYPYQSLNVRLSSQGRPDRVLEFPPGQLTQGFFNMQIKAGKGWHRLLVTGTRHDGRRDTVSVNRVGIGEVFLIAGNSNAMGLPNLGAIGGSENVITIDTVNKYLNSDIITVAVDEPLRSPAFTQFTSERFSYPAGETSWLWAELGDLIYKRYGTPVLFLNAGWANANSVNYQEAASGKDTENYYVGKKWPYRQPYTNVVNTLKYFHSWLGIRSVIWSHGENDAYYFNVNQTTYQNNIQYLIQKARQDFGFNVPWVIGISTVAPNFNKPYMPVNQAQKNLANMKGFNTWQGADTDTVQVPRPAHGHFENIAGGVQGLSLAAKAWNRSLPDTFFRAIIPIQPGVFIHTGAVPAQAFPGASFTLPYTIADTAREALTLQAELLTESGEFVAIVGTGKNSPLVIKLPVVLGDGTYKIRLAGTNPIRVGTVSEVIDVRKKYSKVGFIRHLNAEKKDSKVDVSWMMTANPGIRQITLQRSTDTRSYTDIHSFSAAENGVQSGVYAFSDSHTENGAVFYRIRMEFGDGRSELSGAIAVFGENPPPTFVIFPNPVTRQYFFLRLQDSETDFTCALYDMTGKQHPIQTDNTQIIGLTEVTPLYSLPPGIYVLKIVVGTNVITQRVVFQ